MCSAWAGAGDCKNESSADDAAGMLQGFKAVPGGALLLQRPDESFNHAILLRTMRRDELLPQAVAAHQRRVAAMVKTSPLSEQAETAPVPDPVCQTGQSAHASRR